MGDNLNNAGKQDDIRINVNESWELRDWCIKLGVTPERLREAVKAVGPLVRDVKAYLAR
ncbi:DUF3606 domain-containing protein [Chitinophaga sedimenti]|uniref:DUF3606 domain-containing protein n=1 Tax=Chitinophaga sedimenti TaxID=2033606 RepID=UPI0020066581|nr:DUF3606 domain-containing protein [Chitinophaga sedimenti]MCK7555035.1 DUF3606 domain-containing protein [Chitinophaga sedimenti]